MHKTNKTIFHLDLDAFFTSVEEIKNPKYKDKPLIVGGRNKNSVVSTCNYVARKYGIHSAMPIFQAKLLCPQATILLGNYHLYEEYSHKFFTLIKSHFTNICEETSIDECYLDVSKIIKNYKNPLHLAKTIQAKVYHKLELIVSIGISYNKFLAKMATDLNKPNGITIIDKKNLMTKIWPLKIDKMHFIGISTTKILQSIGINTIGDLANFKNLKLLASKLGKNWYSIYENAKGNGIDFLDLSKNDPKSLSVSHTLLNKTNDINEIEIILENLCHELSNKLKFYSVSCLNISLSYKYDLNHIYTKNIICKKPINSFNDLYNYATLLINNLVFTKQIRLLGVNATKLIKNNLNFDQLSIFSYDKKIKEKKIEDEMQIIIDKVNQEIGKNLLLFGKVLNKSK